MISVCLLKQRKAVYFVLGSLHFSELNLLYPKFGPCNYWGYNVSKKSSGEN